ncbi:MAG: MBL fold metallo-hydrolase [Pyrinomonadaceae bacterium]
MKIVPLSIPTPFYVGDVNVYLIKSDPLTLIDVGPKTDEAREALRDGLYRNGVDFKDVRRIVLTHAHEDHCGLAKEIRDEAKNAEVLVHEWETGHFVGRLQDEHQAALMIRAGVPGFVFDELRSTYSEMRLLTDTLSPNEITPLKDHDELEFSDGFLRVLHTPGHTPGSCSLIRDADRTFVCGDCVLKRITPNPVLAPDPANPSKRFPSLSRYLQSLGRIRDEAPTKVFGGHGDSIDDFGEVFGRYQRAINERQSKVIGLVPRDGITPWELSRLLFPDAIDDKFHRFLAISETIAHLDYAVSEAKLEISEDNDVEFYRGR